MVTIKDANAAARFQLGETISYVQLVLNGKGATGQYKAGIVALYFVIRT